MTSPPAKRRAPLPYPLGWLPALVYASAIARRNRRFDQGKGVVTLDRPILSVGNLSVGGTGKTPMVMHVVRTLRAAGLRPCISIRGYAAVNNVSDEADELARAFRAEVPVVVAANRADALISFFATRAGESIDAVVLDDGFQHRRLARQLDLVLIDATRDPFHDELLPAGYLREPLASLRRAHAVVITHAEAASPADAAALSRRVTDLAPHALVAVARHAWSNLAVLDDARERDEPLTFLAHKRLVAACAIGNPRPFLDAVRRAAQRDTHEIALRDHDPYHRSTVERLLRALRDSSADALVVTDKDWSKLRRLPPTTWPCPVVRPRLALAFDQGESPLNALIVARATAHPDEP